MSALLLAGGLLAGCAEEPAQQEETGQDEKTGIEIGMTFDSFIIERWQRTGMCLCPQPRSWGRK